MRYIDVLQDLVQSYNDTYHCSIGCVACGRDESRAGVAALVRSRRSGRTKVSVEDRVRSSKAKRHFKKGYIAN